MEPLQGVQKKSYLIAQIALRNFLFCSERQQCDIACALDCNGYLTLMLSAVTGNAARQDLATLSDVALQLCYILVVDVLDLINAEAANLLAWASASISSDHDKFLLFTD